MIDKINNMSDVVLVATQVIEAGVDIDMDIGYKDISRLDSEEQFMGRINRSGKRQEKCISIILIKLRIFTEMIQELILTRHWKAVISANILIPKISLSIMKM